METLEKRKQSMIAALWSNPNLDDDKGSRKNAIDDIEEKCEEAVQIILTGIDPNKEVEVEDTYGFFAAGERGAAKIAQPRTDDGSVKDAVDYDKYIDQ